LVNLQVSRAGAQVWSHIAWKRNGHIRAIPSIFDLVTQNPSIIKSNYQRRLSERLTLFLFFGLFVLADKFFDKSFLFILFALDCNTGAAMLMTAIIVAVAGSLRI